MREITLDEEVRDFLRVVAQPTTRQLTEEQLRNLLATQARWARELLRRLEEARD